MPAMEPVLRDRLLCFPGEVHAPHPGVVSVKLTNLRPRSEVPRSGSCGTGIGASQVESGSRAPARSVSHGHGLR
jgi:hypothetical protein